MGDDVPLRDYVDMRLVALDDRVTQLDELRRQAVIDARETIDQRLSSMNEFRGALADLANRAASRDQLDGLRDKLNDLRIQVAGIAALVSLLVGLLVRWLTH